MPKYNALSVNPDKNVYSTLGAVEGGIPKSGGFRPGKYNALKNTIKSVKERFDEPWVRFRAGTDLIQQAHKEGRKLTPEEDKFIAQSALDVGMGAGTFIGIKGIAQMGKTGVLKAAEKLKASGVADTEIWRRLGVTFKFPDKLPRMEISDKAAKLKDTASKASRVDEALEAPVLEAYPNLQASPFSLTLDQGTLGSFSPRAGLKVSLRGENPTSTAIHEIQHGVQKAEGFAGGGGMKEFAKTSESLQAALTNPFAKKVTAAYKAKDIPAIKKLKQENPEEFRKMGLALKTLGTKNLLLAQEKVAALVGKTPYERYRRLAGEAEARLTQSRLSMTDAERRLAYPPAGFDVPAHQQIIRHR
jgi:hypothetical protein